MANMSDSDSSSVFSQPTCLSVCLFIPDGFFFFFFFFFLTVGEQMLPTRRASEMDAAPVAGALGVRLSRGAP